MDLVAWHGEAAWPGVMPEGRLQAGRLQSCRAGPPCAWNRVEARDQALDQPHGQAWPSEAWPSEEGARRQEGGILCLAGGGDAGRGLVRPPGDGGPGPLFPARQDPPPRPGQDLRVAGVLPVGSVYPTLLVSYEAGSGPPGVVQIGEA